MQDMASTHPAQVCCKQGHSKPLARPAAELCVW
jgi:hypothetical protein